MESIAVAADNRQESNAELRIGGPRAVRRPLVSIIVPVFNMGRFLPRSLDSFLAQSIHDIEVIVCDNASTDDTPLIAQRYMDDRVRYYRNDSNIGMINNFNAGLKLACGKYVTFISCDEFMLGEDSLKKRIDLLESDQGIDLVWCDYDFETTDGRVVAFKMKYLKKDVLTAAEGIQAVYDDVGSTSFRITTVIVRRQLLEVTNYVLPLVHAGDRPMLLAWMIQSRNVAWVREVIHRSYMHSDHRHDFFGRPAPFIGERCHVMLKFIDENRPRLIAMGLSIERLEWLVLRQLVPLWLRMPRYQFSNFYYYANVIIRRSLALLGRAVVFVLIAPLWFPLRGIHYCRTTLAKIPLLKRLYRFAKRSA